MKNLTTNLLTILMVILFSITAFSCGSEDDDAQYAGSCDTSPTLCTDYYGTITVNESLCDPMNSVVQDLATTTRCSGTRTGRCDYSGISNMLGGVDLSQIEYIDYFADAATAPSIQPACEISGGTYTAGP